MSNTAENLILNAELRSAERFVSHGLTAADSAMKRDDALTGRSVSKNRNSMFGGSPVDRTASTDESVTPSPRSN